MKERVRLRAAISFAAVLVGTTSAHAQGAVWGGFAETRLQIQSEVLNVGYGLFRGAISSAGGTVTAPTHLLTPEYLAGIDVFFTGRLPANTGALTAEEKVALAAWVQAGGTLIVTVDDAAVAAYEGYTAPYGVMGYTAISNTGTGDALPGHPLSNGADGFEYETNATFSFGSDARVVLDDGIGDNPFMIVLEPSTGYVGGGRILVVGDHQLFDSPQMASPVNVQLAFNVAKWASNTPETDWVWGSFDDTSQQSGMSNFAGVSHHAAFREVVLSHGGTIVPGTPVVTAEYLADVDVFYAGLLSSGDHGILTSAEQAALQAWIASGGTLILIAGTNALSSAETFTSAYGVTNYTSLKVGTTANVVASHPITQGLSTFSYASNSTFSHGPDARLLATSSNGNDYLLVLEPATGFAAGGRIVVFGSGAFTSITAPENLQLAQNLVAWAAAPPTPICAADDASWTTYGQGWPGTFGVPTIAALGAPRAGEPIDVVVINSRGLATTAFPLLGIAPAAEATSLGGTVLVDFVPALAVPLPMPASGLVLSGTIPFDASLCGVTLHLQVLEVDPGASGGASFTRGLALTIGH